MRGRSVSLTRYQRDLEARGLRPNTVRTYVRTVAEFLEALGGPPSRAREKDVRNYVVALQQQRASSFRFGRGGPGGWVIVDEPRVALAEDIRVPDLAGWRAERHRRPLSGPYDVIPDWVCEVLSPGTAVIDRTEKLPLYARCSVPWLWLIEPVACTLEAYRREAEGYLLVVTAHGVGMLRAPPFDAIELELELLWGDRFDPNAARGREEWRANPLATRVRPGVRAVAAS